MISGINCLIKCKEAQVEKKLMINLVFVLIFFVSAFAGNVGKNYSQNCVYVELPGQRILGSINYEYRFTPFMNSDGTGAFGQDCLWVMLFKKLSNND